MIATLRNLERFAHQDLLQRFEYLLHSNFHLSLHEMENKSIHLNHNTDSNVQETTLSLGPFINGWRGLIPINVALIDKIKTKDKRELNDGIINQATTGDLHELTDDGLFYAKRQDYLYSCFPHKWLVPAFLVRAKLPESREYDYCMFYMGMSAFSKASGKSARNTNSR